MVGLEGHATTKLEIVAHEGKPVELEVKLIPLIPLEIATPGTTLLLDDKAVVPDQGGLAVPDGAHVLVAKAPGFHDARFELPAERPGFKLAIKLVEVGTLVELAGAPAGAQLVIDGKVVATAPLREPIEVAPGTHAVEVKFSGYRPYRTTGVFVADRRAQLRIGALRRDDRRRTKIAGIATGTALLGGAVFSVLALGRESAYSDRVTRAGVTTDDADLRDMKSAGERYALLADVGFGLAIAGIAVTTYLFTHEGRGESEGSLRIDVGAVSGHAGAVVSGRF